MRNGYRTVTATLAVLLLGLSGPLAAAQPHGLPVDPSIPNQPAFPAAPADQNNVPPIVNRAVGGAYGGVAQTYNGTSVSYRILQDSLNPVLNQTIPRELVVYRDGAGGPNVTGPDATFGGFGLPRTFGSPVWAQSSGAARSGQQGYSTPTNLDGTYPANTRSLLLTPEIDMRGTLPLDSKLDDVETITAAWQEEVQAACRPGSGNVLFPHCFVYANLPWYALGGARYGAIYNAFLGRGISSDTEARLTFQTRYNLASVNGAGRDGVGVMVFTTPPETIPASYSSCSGSCTIVGPLPPNYDVASSHFVSECPKGDKYSASGTGVCVTPQPFAYDGAVNGLDGQPGFTGYSGWKTITIDLTPWMGKSVWVGFYFASRSPLPDNQGAAFFPQAGFRGFQLDDLVVTVPSTHDNLQVRPLHPLGPISYGQVLPTLLPNAPMQIRTEVRNVGQTGTRVRIHTQLVDFDDSSRVYFSNTSTEYDMPRGSIIEVAANVTVPDLGTIAVASVAVERVAGGDPTGNPLMARAAVDSALSAQNGETCKVHGNLSDEASGVPWPTFADYIEPTDGAGGTYIAGRGGWLIALDVFSEWVKDQGRHYFCAGRIGDAEPRDDVALTVFTVKEVRAVLQKELTRNAGNFQASDPIEYTLILENVGNVVENRTLWTRVYDVANPQAPILLEETPLPYDQIEQKINLAPGETAKLQWQMQIHKPGQYQLFVGDAEEEGLNATVDLLPRHLQPIRVPFIDLDKVGSEDEMAMDGQVQESVWLRAAAFTANLKSPTNERSGRLPIRMFHDGSDLYVAAIRTPTPLQDTASPKYSTLTALFHGGGDPIGRPQEGDGIHLQAGDPSKTRDLYYAVGMPAFAKDMLQNDLGGRHGSTSATRVKNNFEFTRPLHAGGQDLALDADGMLGFFLNLTAATSEFQFPIGAHAQDGGMNAAGTSPHGLRLPDGSLADELQGWQRLRLLPSEEAGSKWPLRALLPGFGVDYSMPPLFLETFEDCQMAPGWTQEGILFRTGSASFSSASDRQTEKWNCGPQGPLGADALFMGFEQSEKTTCFGGKCHPWALARGSSGSQFLETTLATLYTPPIEMRFASDPWLVFQNQISNLVKICDGVITVPEPQSSLSCSIYDMNNHQRHILPLTAGRLFVETWNENLQDWTSRIFLLPEGGYTTERSLGIQDPARDGFAGRALIEPILHPCTDYGQACGWWDPAGYIPGYQMKNDSIMAGGNFHGSPWRIDRVPLFGLHGLDGATLVDVEGKTIRLGFQFDRYTTDMPYSDMFSPPYDIGWRLGSVAVLNAPRFQRDVGIHGLHVATNAFDPVLHGVGPNTDLPVMVQIRNEGLVETRKLSVQVVGFDPAFPEGPDNVICDSQPQGMGNMLFPGDWWNVTVACPIGDHAGARLRLRAQLTVDDGDEFLPNNRMMATDSYQIQVFEDAAVVVGATPEVASEATTRKLFLTLENRGNVPLSGLDILRTISRRGPAGNELLDDFTRVWHVQGTLGIGASLRIESPILNVTPAVGAAMDFRPPHTGGFEMMAHILSADAVSDNNAQSITMKALAEFYQENFDTPRVADPAVVEGTWSTDNQTVWGLVSEGDAHGRHLRAGDLETGRIPKDTDASLFLPKMELTALSGAALSMNHRYDLERFFDAARVEASTDGGDTWLPLTPKKQPLAGLPEGYPSVPIFGPSPLLSNATEARAIAFTGNSGDYPALAAADGYLVSEFNLASHPGLRQASSLEIFRFDGFSSLPLATPIETSGKEIQFQHPTWNVGEGAASNGRSWWIENLTRSLPAPHSGSAMWWSGSAGEASPEHPVSPICNGLGTTLDLSLVPLSHNRLILTWWDWRSGWQDDASRLGRGGQYGLGIQRLDSDADGVPDAVERMDGTDINNEDSDNDGYSDGANKYSVGPTSQNKADTDDDGLADAWEKPYFGNDLTKTHWSGDPDQDGLNNLQEQTYGTNPTKDGWDTDLDGVPDGIEVSLGTNPRFSEDGHVLETRPDGWTRRAFDLTPYRTETIQVMFFYTWKESSLMPSILNAANYGWFVDDVEATAWIEDATSKVRVSPVAILPLQTMDGLDLDQETHEAGPWRTFLSRPDCSKTHWTLVGQGASATPSGWYVQANTTVPGKGKTSVWRFASPNIQGYPHLADARLVTPTVDLSQIEGSAAKLRFHHKYGFEALTVAPAGDAAGAIRTAMDGGVVEFQVRNEATGEFGPWQQLFKEFRNAPDRALLAAAERNGRVAPTGLFKDSPLAGELSNREKVAASGYPALELRGMDWLTQHPRLARVYAGQGNSLEVFPGKINHPTLAWRDYPVSYLFGGASQGIDGWEENAWDITPLIGKQVRFGFHAVSNPQYAGSKPLPFAGWALSEVGIEGEIFSGKPVQIRLHAATDGSLLEGSWDVDDLLIVGTPFNRNLVVQGGLLDRLVLPGSQVEIHANVTNLGNAARGDLALAFEVLDAKTLQGYDAYQVVVPDSLPEIESGRVVSSMAGAKVVGPFALSSVGGLGSSIPIHVRLNTPATPSEIKVKVTVLEGSGLEGQRIYRLPSNELSGAIQAAWNVVGEVRSDLRMVQPAADNNALLVVSPGAPVATYPVLMKAAVANHGTTVPQLAAQWRLDEVKRKGPVVETNHVREELGVRVDWSDDLGSIPTGETLTSLFNRTPVRDGLYRVTVVFTADGVPVQTTSKEFLVGLSGTYYQVDFSKTDGQSGWRDQSANVNATSGGGTPPESRWREQDGRFIWGVSPIQAQLGITYCTTVNASCNTSNQGFPAGTPPPPPNTYFGMEGLGVSPRVNLTRVPQGQAILTLRQGHFFEADDGGRLEVRPLRTPVNPAAPKAAFSCDDGTDGWFALDPTPLEKHAGLARSRGSEIGIPTAPGQGPYVMPHRLNPIRAPFLAPVPVLGGDSVASETVRYDMAQSASPLCPELPSTVLLNYTVEFRMRAGTRPGSTGPPGPTDLRRGAVGWQVDALQVSSIDFDVQPRLRELPILDGAAKQFSLQVTNRGPVPERFLLRLDGNASSLLDNSWVTLEQTEVLLNPGQSGRVPFTVHIEPDPTLSRGKYAAVIAVASARNPLIEHRTQFDLMLNPNPLADLSMQLSVEAEGVPPAFEAGTIVPIHATVHNLGRRAAPASSLRMVASSPDGETRVIGTAPLPGLCPLVTCGKGGSTATATIEWMVPTQTGLYQIHAEADAGGVVLESRRDNNVRILAARSVPLNRPDVRVDSLHVQGLSEDGFAEEGAIVQLIANVTNIGNAPAEQVQVRILAGSAQLTEVVVPLLNPGETRSISAYKAAPAGQTVVSALALLPSGLETNVNNNEVRRILHVRGHDLGMGIDASNVTVAPGGSVTLTATIHNRANTVERALVKLEGESAKGWALGVNPNPVVIASNSSAPVVLILRAPDEAQGGTIPLRLVAYAVNHPTVRVNVTLPAIIPERTAAPRLEIGNLTTAPGDVLVPFTLRSNSNVALRLNVTLRNPSWIAAPATVDLPARRNITGELLVTIPPGALPQTHLLHVGVRDTQGWLTLGVGQVTVRSQMALGAHWVRATPTQEAFGSKQLAFELALANIGNVPVRVRAVPTELAQGYLAEPVETSTVLPPAANGTLVLLATVAPDAPTGPAGRVNLWAIMEDGTLAEPVATLELPALDATANLVMARMEVIPKTALAVGEEARIMVRVENRGILGTPSTNLSGYVNGVLVQDVAVPPLPPGGWKELNLTWWASAAGRQLVTLVADGNHRVLESNEDDNGGSVEITVDKSLLDPVRELPTTWWGTLLALALALLWVDPRRRRGE